MVFVRYAPAKIRYEGDRPIALLKVRIAPSFRLVDLPLGTPTTSARSERGTWALYALGAEVVVVHPRRRCQRYLPWWVKSARPLASPTAYSQPPGTPLARSWSSTST